MSSPLIQGVVQQAGKIILGKERQIRLALACLLASGHLLIEDLPGVGKTTLAQVLAKLLGLNFHRIQFTSDMLPPTSSAYRSMSAKAPPSSSTRVPFSRSSSSPTR